MTRAARSRKCTLGGRYGFPALLFAVVSTVVTSESSVTKPCVHTRGGSKEEDVALDAYIDELIASVDEENNLAALGDETSERSSPDDLTVIVASTRPRKRRSSKKKKKQLEAQFDDSSSTSGDEEVMKGHQTSDANEEEGDLVPHTNRNHSISDKEKQLDEYNEQEGEEIEESSEEVQVELQEEESEEVQIEIQEQGNIQETNNCAAIPPPNALYRFLLDLGIVGQTLALLLMFITDYLNAYVPFLSSLVSYFLPQPQRNDRTRPERRAMSQLASSAVSSRRTGQSSRQRRKLTKQADQMALDQLKRVGNVHEAKYRYVSLEFLTRHGLGSYATTQAENSATDEVTFKKSSGVSTTEKEEGDWVLDALTKDLLPKRGDSKSRTPRIVFEFDIQQRTQVAKAALTPKNRKKSVRRIRAAAGANSKSLLGAYPGDAVSLDEAADPRGVYDLARRYGWGEWEDDEDVAPSSYLSHSRIKKRHRKASHLSEWEDITSSPIDVDRSKDRFQQPAFRNPERKSRFDKEKGEKDSSVTRLRNKVANRTRHVNPRDPLERLVQGQGEKKEDER